MPPFPGRWVRESDCFAETMGSNKQAGSLRISNDANANAVISQLWEDDVRSPLKNLPENQTCDCMTGGTSLAGFIVGNDVS